MEHVAGISASVERSLDKPKTADVYVGMRVRLRRNVLGMSQQQLGKVLGITFQKIPKYERGTNTIGASLKQLIGPHGCVHPGTIIAVLLQEKIGGAVNVEVGCHNRYAISHR